MWSQLPEEEKKSVTARFVPFIRESYNGAHRTAAWWVTQLYVIDSTHQLLAQSETPLLPTMDAFTRIVHRLHRAGVLKL